MRKFPRRFQNALITMLMMPTMLLSMSAIMAYRSMPVGSDFVSAWGQAIAHVAPTALLLIAVVAPTIRLFVTKILLQPEEAEAESV